MTLDEISKLAGGVSKKHLSQLINGHTDASPQLAGKLARILKTEEGVWIFNSSDDLAARRKAYRDLCSETNTYMRSQRKLYIDLKRIGM